MPNNARESMTAKLKLEDALRPQLTRYNNKVIQNYIRELGLHGNLFNIQVMDLELRDILFLHYQKTQDVFSDNFGIPPTEEEDELILAAMFIFFSQEAPANARLINSTTTRDMVGALDLARADPLVIDSPDRRTLATVAGANLNRKLTGRVATILTSETQVAAESSKLTEAQVLSGLEPSVIGGSARSAGARKEWVTVGDDRVRVSHIVADGQKVDINEPFIVQGQQLMVPRDRSRGASMDNVMGCRCEAVYDVEGIKDLR